MSPVMICNVPMYIAAVIEFNITAVLSGLTQVLVTHDRPRMVFQLEHNITHGLDAPVQLIRRPCLRELAFSVHIGPGDHDDQNE